MTSRKNSYVKPETPPHELQVGIQRTLWRKTRRIESYWGGSTVAMVDRLLQWLRSCGSEKSNGLANNNMQDASDVDRLSSTSIAMVDRLQWLRSCGSEESNGLANNNMQYASDFNVLSSSSVAMVDRLQWLSSCGSEKSIGLANNNVQYASDVNILGSSLQSLIGCNG